MKWVQREALTQEQEEELIRAAQAGDQTARNRLIESHLPFVRMVVGKRPCPPWLERDDLLQAAIFGFVRAIEKWEDNKGCRLLGYAKWWMRSALDDEIEYSRLYRVPRVVLDAIKKGRTGVSEKTRQAAADFQEMSFFSDFDDPADYHKGFTPCQEVELKELKEAVQVLLSQLTPKHGKIIQLRMAGMTLRHIGKVLGLGTRENVRLVELAALQEFAQKWSKQHGGTLVPVMSSIAGRRQVNKKVLRPSKKKVA